MTISPSLPAKLQEVFRELSQGRHISSINGDLYSSLVADADLYREIFVGLGFTMEYDPHGFFYFDAIRKGQGLAQGTARIALFVYLYIDHLTNSNKGVEAGLFDEPIDIRSLPHFKTERYQSLMRQVDIDSIDEMEKLMRDMERFGFVEHERGSGVFRFLAPVRRIIKACEGIVQQVESAQAVEEEER